MDCCPTCRSILLDISSSHSLAQSPTWAEELLKVGLNFLLLHFVFQVWMCLLRRMWMCCLACCPHISLWAIVTFVKYFIVVCIYILFTTLLDFWVWMCLCMWIIFDLWCYFTVLHWGVCVLLSMCTLCPVENHVQGFCMERAVLWISQYSTMCWFSKLCIKTFNILWELH